MTVALNQLHDATLVSIHFDWATRRCIFEFRGVPSLPQTFSLIFLEVSQLSIPAELPWGRSVSVLTACESRIGCFEFEMQSGDVIVVMSEQGYFCKNE